MTRAHHVTHSYTAIRIQRIRSLITALQLRQMMREDIADLLQVGPSGVRKYVRDLSEAGVIAIARCTHGSPSNIGAPIYRLALSASETGAFLASLAIRSYARQAPTSDSLSAKAGSGRHFHILADDTHYAIRVNRAPAARDWSVTALFGAGRHVWRREHEQANRN